MTIPADGPARKAISSPTSSGSTRRLIADSVSMIFSTTCSSGMPCVAAWSLICLSTSGVRT